MASRKAVIRCKTWPPERKKEVSLDKDSNMTDAIRETLKAIDLEDFIISDESIKTIQLVAELPQQMPTVLEGAGAQMRPTRCQESLDAIGGRPVVDYLGRRWLIFIRKEGKDQATDYLVSFN
ncbi:uncharacterized protein LOC134240370 [Saccostrea cucullata]|uniref:uncharacterized protein LOC134240370 n=1 Tax=Saccostrea cuccullata TaxID=36930 RepID=UPI002ED1F35B